MPHVLTRSGDVVAILFGFPLASPPREGLNNKILWVQREGPTSPVEISAQRMEGTEPVGEPVGATSKVASRPRTWIFPSPAAGG